MCKEFLWRYLKMGVFKNNFIDDKNIHSQPGPPGPGFKKTSDGNYDVEDKKTSKSPEVC